MSDRARQGLEVGVGLALLGLQRWMTLRPDIERELDRLGHHLVADVSRRVGEVVGAAIELAASSVSASTNATTSNKS